MFRSGTEEEYGEKEILLQEVHELYAEGMAKRAEPKGKKDLAIGEGIRRKALQGLKVNASPQSTAVGDGQDASTSTQDPSQEPNEGKKSTFHRVRCNFLI